MVPYIEPSADPVLQARLFSYPDTHRHRLGPNYNQLPVNAPSCPFANFQRDGAMTFVSQGSKPNYQSSTQPLTYQKNAGWVYGEACDGGEDCDMERRINHENFVGAAFRDLSVFTERKYSLGLLICTLDLIGHHLFSVDLEQPRAVWSSVWTDEERDALVENLAAHMVNIKNKEIANRECMAFLNQLAILGLL